MIGVRLLKRRLAYTYNMERFKFVKKYYRQILLSLVIVFISWFYLTSADNFTNMLSGDGYFHSLIAQNIIKNGSIEYEWPLRVFNGLKDSSIVSHYPVHYSQLYHLTLALFNNLGGLGVFAWQFTFYINLLVCLGTYIFFRKMGAIGILAPLICILAVGYRVFAVNFMEGYLLLLFVGILWAASRYYESSRSESRYPVFYYLSVFFIGLLTITKQIGLVDGITLFGILCLISLTKKEIKKVFLTTLLMAGTVLGPLYSLYRGIGTFGYGTGSLTLPSFIPFSDLITKFLFTSRYQFLPSHVPRVLAYQVDRSLFENINKISNYFFVYGRQGVVLNLVFLAVYATGLYSIFKRSKKLGYVIAAIFLSEFLIVNWQNLILTKYTIVLIYLTGFLLSMGLFYLSEKFSLYKKYIPAIFILLLTIFFVGQHGSLYHNVGRKTREMELLYVKMGEYIQTNYSENNNLFLASDPQFGVWSKHDYIWYPDLYWGDWDNELSTVVNTYNVRYLVITSTNINNSGLYDEIPQDKYDKIITSSRMTLVKRYQHGSDFVELWELSGIN